MKTDVETLAEPLAILQAMRSVSYRSLIDESRPVGLLAQEVAPMLPEAVRTGLDGRLVVNYKSIVGVLVEAVKTLSARVDARSGAAMKGDEKP